MNYVIPDGATAWAGVKNFFGGLGLVPSLVLGLIVIALLVFAFGGVSGAFDSWRANREIENLKQEADELRKQAATAEVEKEQYKGAAAAYKEQAAGVQNELTELFNARPELQRQTAAATQRVQEIRNRPVRPVTDDMRKRVDDFGAKLDALYPDN